MPRGTMVVAAVTLLIILSACGNHSTEATIEGTVDLRPVAQPNTATTWLASRVIGVFSTPSNVMVNAITTTGDAFKMKVSPGTYEVSGLTPPNTDLPGQLPTPCGGPKVTIKAGQTKSVFVPACPSI